MTTTTHVSNGSCEHGDHVEDVGLLALYTKYRQFRDAQAAQDRQASHQERLSAAEARQTKREAQEDARNAAILDRVGKAFGRNTVVSYNGDGSYTVKREGCGHEFRAPIGSEHHDRKACSKCRIELARAERLKRRARYDHRETSTKSKEDARQRNGQAGWLPVLPVRSDGR
jgi:hypothetical protein